jgi:hypothetical protein
MLAAALLAALTLTALAGARADAATTWLCRPGLASRLRIRSRRWLA